MKVIIPPSREQDQSQLSALDANRAKAVSACRYKVEVRHGHIKLSFKCFDGRVNFHNLLQLKTYLDIAGALYNKYRMPLTPDRETAELATLIRERLNTPNTLQQTVIRQNLLRYYLFFPILKTSI